MLSWLENYSKSELILKVVIYIKKKINKSP